MELYESIPHLVETFGCTYDYAIVILAFEMIVFFALVGWSLDFFLDVGGVLYKLTKKLFAFLVSQVTKKKP